MRKITMFMFESCPHCQLALRLMRQLLAEHPEYAAIPLEQIDEKLHPDIAEKYDYWYVPTYYVGEKKVHEGHAELPDIQAVFEQALKG